MQVQGLFLMFFEEYYHNRPQVKYTAINFNLGKTGKDKKKPQ